MTTDQKPLPFIYQFAAGAVAGISEVCSYAAMQARFRDQDMAFLERMLEAVIC